MLNKITKTTFHESLPNNWKDIFLDEYNVFWDLFVLYWFNKWNDLIWGFCLWYNPDYFKDKIDNIIIDNLNTNKYEKISYFFIKDKYKWNNTWWELLVEFMDTNWWKYFLTCDNGKLRDYYVWLWFELVNENEDKFILVYEK